MKVLLDECRPRHLKRALSPHVVQTVREAGWSGIKNGELLTLAEPLYEVFLTADRNLRYQQNLAKRRIAIVEIPTNRLEEVLSMAPKILRALDKIKSGDYVEIESEG